MPVRLLLFNCECLLQLLLGDKKVVLTVIIKKLEAVFVEAMLIVTLPLSAQF